MKAGDANGELLTGIGSSAAFEGGDERRIGHRPVDVDMGPERLDESDVNVKVGLRFCAAPNILGSNADVDRPALGQPIEPLRAVQPQRAAADVELERAAANRRGHHVHGRRPEELRDKPISQLSYGQQKRVELGRALACEPRLLLLDEIVAGMNREEKEDIARFILDTRDEFGIAILMIEHDMQVVMDLSDRVYVLDFGSLIAEGTPAEVAVNPLVLQAYLGEEAAHA